MMVGKAAVLIFWSMSLLYKASGFVSLPPSSPLFQSRPTLVMSTSSAVGERPRRVLEQRRLAREKAKVAKTRETLVVDTTDAPVKQIVTHDEYLDALAANEDNLVVVKFFAPWCRSCKAMDVKYRKLAVENPDVRFFEVNVAEAMELKKALGVKAVPTVKIHAGDLGQIASFSCGPRKVSQLVRKIELCRDVPTLTARMSKGSGMVEMVAGQMADGEMEDASVVDVSPITFNAPATTSSSEPVGLVKGLMEKFAGQEMLARALAEAQLTDLPQAAPCLA